MSNLKVFNQTITNPRTQEYLQSVLGERKGEFINNLTALVANNVLLQDCEPTTLMYAALKATALELPFDNNLGFAYVIPYKNNNAKTTVAQFQIGYKGIVQLAIRSAQFHIINVTDIRDGELVRIDRLTGKHILNWIDDDAERQKRKIVGYLGYFKLLNGYEKEKYMSIEELKAHGLQYSQTYRSTNEKVKKSSKWETDFDAMARKTVLKLILSKGDAPMSVQMRQAVKYDQAVIVDEKGTAEYLDNPKSIDTAEVEAIEAEVVTEAEQQAAADLFG